MSSVPSTSVGENLRQARAGLRLSLAEVASRAGISIATLSRIETDKQNLDVAMLTKLADILGISPVDLLGEATDGNRRSVTRQLAQMAPGERVRAYCDASRRGDVSIDDLVAMVDVLREELGRLQRSTRARRRH